MHLSVNGTGMEVADGLTVAGLLDHLGQDNRGVAVAVGEEVVPRSTWAGAVLRPGDRVEVLVAAQGG
ncbi:MAG: sulfur carrier protein ThiS [Acidimicrobiales bacterium]|jgi:sulfur carrier protein|nr:sulfur carrier protein ThiS [Acidimicrobiales bacterium]